MTTHYFPPNYWKCGSAAPLHLLCRWRTPRICGVCPRACDSRASLGARPYTIFEAILQSTFFTGSYGDLSRLQLPEFVGPMSSLKAPTVVTVPAPPASSSAVTAPGSAKPSIGCAIGMFNPVSIRDRSGGSAVKGSKSRAPPGRLPVRLPAHGQGHEHPAGVSFYRIFDIPAVVPFCVKAARNYEGHDGRYCISPRRGF